MSDNEKSTQTEEPNFRYNAALAQDIENKWQKIWDEQGTFWAANVNGDLKDGKGRNAEGRTAYFAMDMFPYPSGKGLHVGHPLGYLASDVVSRYHRMKGENVLHAMGYDAFGLPAEQYAIQTGQHPAVTTEQNIARYREQLDKIGFSFDWDREVRTCDPGYYKWTQWAFLEMFSHWYDRSKQQARPVAELTAAFETSGTEGLDAACTTEMHFTAAEWNAKSEREKEQILQNYRLAFRADTQVNWCPKLGTVLANDEVHDGLSVRGGYPVEQKRMKQWLLRVTAYAQRMLDGLDKLEWSDSLKEIQRNWIGRSEGAQVFFDIENSDRKLEIFTTRPDTIFGVTFMVIAPEHEWVGELTTPENKAAVEEYIRQTKKRSERDRIADTKRVSGVATGSYAINPFTNKAIPIYISDYVLSGYGTGAIMAVPAHDSRDWAFARHFGLEIVPVVEGSDIEKESYDAKTGKVINSDFLNGMDVKEAIQVMFAEVEKRGLGKKLVNYRLRDAIFSRQRYWGARFPRPAAGGGSRSRSTIRTTRPTRWRRTNCRWSCRPSRISAPRPRANRRWPASRDGRRPRAAPTNCRRCPDSPDRRPTTCATWIRTTTKRSWATPPTNTGVTSISTSAASNTRQDT